MSRYPLLFTFRDVIVGRCFVAGVRAEGRALTVEQPDGEFWMYGIEPGAIAGSGDTLLDAHVNFRETHRLALYDIAHEASDFRAFKAEVEAYYGSTPEATLKEWEAAVEEVRAGQVKSPGLPKQDASSPRGLTVFMAELAPEANERVLAPALESGSNDENQLALAVGQAA